MKFYTLAMLLLMFNISLAIINYIDEATGYLYQSTYMKEWTDEVGNKELLNQSYSSSTVEPVTTG